MSKKDFVLKALAALFLLALVVVLFYLAGFGYPGV